MRLQPSISKSGQNEENRIYCYILAHDGGWAPCPDNGMLTLAVCKPAIRRTIRENDWIVGITPKKEGRKTPKKEGRKLAYIAKVTTKMRGEKYYKGENRKDKIYSYQNSTYKLRHEKFHNERHKARDVGNEPDYKNAWIIESNEFWYYGINAKDFGEFGEFPYFLKTLKNLTQGHLVNHTPKVRAELDKLIEQIKLTPGGKLGSPRDRKNGCER